MPYSVVTLQFLVILRTHTDALKGRMVAALHIHRILTTVAEV